MNQITLVASCMMVAAVWGSAAANAQDVPLRLDIALTATIQNPDSATNRHGTVTVSTSTAKLTMKGLLALCATNHPDVDYTKKGLTLALLGSDVVVVDKTNAVIDTVNDLFSWDSGTGVTSGTYSEIDGTYNEKTVQEFDFAYSNSLDETDPLQFDVYGLRTFNESNNGKTVTESMDCKVMGSGTMVNAKDNGDSDRAVFSGTISGSGKVALLN